MKKRLTGAAALILAASLAGCSAVDKVNEKTSEEPVSSAVEGGSETTPTEETTVSTTENVVLPDEEGYAEGYIGDTMRNAFFDYVVNSASIVSDYKGIKPAEDKDLLVVNITIMNTSTSSLPMFDTDFFLYQPNETEDDKKYIDTVTAADTSLKAEGMLEPEYSIGIHETVTGDLVYEVPKGQKDFIFAFEEYFENNEYGDVFVVRFTAK